MKSKTFATSIGSDVITAEELPDRQHATGRVLVDGEDWREGTTAGPAHDIGQRLAYASAGERLEPGDVISTVRMPTCCGLELDRWIQPGSLVELEIDGIGTLGNRSETAILHPPRSTGSASPFLGRCSLCVLTDTSLPPGSDNHPYAIVPCGVVTPS